MPRPSHPALLLAAAALFTGAPARADDTGNVGTTPVLGTGVPLAQVPANVQVVDRAALDREPGQPLSATLSSRLPSGTYTDSQGNAWNTTLNLRGYEASPVLGTPQGVAVYQDGQRINDPFGDVVNWATVPGFAVDRVEVTPGSNPVFGQNALGGAAALRMKDGWSAPGARMSLVGSSTPGVSGSAEYGYDGGALAFYGGVAALHDDGWRDRSPSDLVQSYLSLGARGERLDGALSFSFADVDLLGNGGAPKDLVDEHYREVFTTPDQSRDQLYNLEARGDWALSGETTLEGNAYLRHNQLRTTNGDDADYGACTGIGGSAAFLCSDPGQPSEALATDASGGALPASTPLTGLRNETFTRTQSAGASAQLSDHADLFGWKSVLVAGTAVDFAWTRYQTGSVAGQLDAQRNVDSLGFSLGGDALNTDLRTQSRGFGLYFSEVASLTQALSATLAGRLQTAHLELHDLSGTALDGTHDFWRFNPALGLTYQWTPAFGTWAGYAEASRTPTPAELACADPERPCRVPNAFTSDPGLSQVVSRSVEIGARGTWSPKLGDLDAGSLHWSVAAYSAWNENDILFVASGPIVGSGYFANAGATRRLGLELSLEGVSERVTWFARYGFLDATFRDAATLRSADNPAADANGDIHVRPGDSLPNLPRHTLKLGFGYALTERWSAGLDTTWVSGRTYQGDEIDHLPDVPGWAIVNLESGYRIGEHAALRLRVENLFGQRYYTSGVLGDPSRVFPAMSDPRFLVPGRTRTFQLGLTARF